MGPAILWRQLTYGAQNEAGPYDQHCRANRDSAHDKEYKRDYKYRHCSDGNHKRKDESNNRQIDSSSRIEQLANETGYCLQGLLAQSMLDASNHFLAKRQNNMVET